MSMEREDYGTRFQIYTGSTETFDLTIKDPDTGEPFNLSDEDIYATGNVTISKPDGTVITTVEVEYAADRATAIVSFTIDDTVAINRNAGNWRGIVELIDITDEVILKQLFNFDILES